MGAPKITTLEWIRALYGRPMVAISSCLRSVIIPRDGYELVCADYNAIETRVLFWMAEHEDGLDGFRQNRDLYREMATHIFNIDHVEDIDDTQRQLGKKAILGCGYGMGKKKFFETCKAEGMEVTEKLAERAVYAYRNAHSPVVQMWHNIEKTAIEAVRKKGRKFRVNKTIWFYEDDFLFCELPSKRRLAYYKPEIRFEALPWGDDKAAKLYHWGANPKTKKWELAGTYGGKLVENCIQGCARDIMVEAMLLLENFGYELLLSVHDELLAETCKVNQSKNITNFEMIMSKVPMWATGCPIKAKGWQGERYRKG